MSDFRFATPEWSAALWGVLAIIALLLWLERRRGNALARFMSPIMQSRLVSRTSTIRRVLVIVLLGISAVCFVVALMRPQFGLTYVKSPRVGAQIIFCLDVSKSMLAEDTAPNRLDRAKADITDLLTFLDGDQVGLIGFAGRATVLCPVTPDYGFFKLILDNANPSSVGRGGTRLEEPLRKALDGFRTESDVSRIVFLITDGEDHDSHPLDVAKDAVEHGIKVVAVGLGDEAGSEIRITDPRTGVQSQVVDSDGKPVITRLDGETLRELALATEGVYIPAGTSSLDLKSIYDVHIKPLVRGEMNDEGRAIRRDVYQWAILVGLLFLLASVVLGSGRTIDTNGDQQRTVSSRVARAAMLITLATLANPGAALGADSFDAVSSAQPAATQQVDARQIYNLGLSNLPSNLDEAESLLSEARREAAGDGEVRYRATYNMGWVEVHRANQMLDEEPEKALEHLQRASGWFRDAIRLRKDSSDARHNLEVVLLRILQLRDQLLKKDDADLANQLDRLIATQRTTIGNLRGLVDQVAASDDPNIADQYRPQFQRLAVDQRVAMSDLQDVVDQAANELESLESKSESEPQLEENIRIAQLASLLNYLSEGGQRLGQSRSQLRRRQASRAFRRAATALNQLKRARDQLRQPLQILDGILADASTTAQQTVLKSLENQSITVAEQEVPAWIDQDYLSDNQADLTQRTQELTTRLASGLKNAQQSDTQNEQEAAQAAEQRDFLTKLQDAMPHLRQAAEAMELAGEKITLPEYAAASEQQIKAIKALQEAREQFADLRGLIELAYATETQIAQALGQLTESTNQQDDETPESAVQDKQSLDDQALQFATANQTKNLERMQRLAREVAKQLASANSTQPPAEANATEGPSSEAQRLELATKLIQQGIEQMKRVADDLNANKQQVDDSTNDNSDDPDDADRPNHHVAAKTKSDAAVKTLQDLRRLFFSIVEHLQETAQRQTALNDETEQLAGTLSESDNDPEAIQQQSAEFGSRQDELAKTAQQIAGALEQQANLDEQNEQNGASDPQQQAMMEQNAEQAKKAAQLVADAKEQMLQASELLGEETPEVAASRGPQDIALEKLIEALRELQPPQQDQSDQQQDQQQNQGDQQQDQQQSKNEQNKKSQDAQMDPSRVLQAVRDREAQRRRDQDRRQRASQIPVDKDW